MAPPRGFDTLAHLDDDRLADRLPATVAEARAAGVDGWLIAGGDPARWAIVTKVAAQTQGVAAVGLHPWWAAELSEPDCDRWMVELDRFDPDVVGEIGLDALHARTDAARQAQRRALRAQLAWARERDRPILVHAVRAIPEVLDVIRRDGLPRRGGAIHGWTAPPDLAERACRLGLHLSFGPSTLLPTAQKARTSLRAIPLERVLIETGAPCRLAPRGPSDLVSVAEGLASVLRTSRDALLSTTGANARALYIR